jgi:hypothetical protein
LFFSILKLFIQKLFGEEIKVSSEIDNLFLNDVLQKACLRREFYGMSSKNSLDKKIFKFCRMIVDRKVS